MVNVDIANATNVVPWGYSHCVDGRVSSDEKWRCKIKGPGKNARKIYILPGWSVIRGCEQIALQFAHIIVQKA